MCLNYGYAVMRAGIARALVAYGLLPALGLHHASATNAFNLADDLIEPFRPFVDLAVWALSDQGLRKDGEPSREDRQSLAGIPLGDARIGRQSMTLLVAMDMAVESLVRAMETSTPSVLFLPSLRRQQGRRAPRCPSCGTPARHRRPRMEAAGDRKAKEDRRLAALSRRPCKSGKAYRLD